jgi:hypothetical protein
MTKQSVQPGIFGFILNGFTMNGFILNGFTMNGFILNGFTMNGFILNGLLLPAKGWTRNDEVSYLILELLQKGRIKIFRDCFALGLNSG